MKHVKFVVYAPSFLLTSILTTWAHSCSRALFKFFLSNPLREDRYCELLQGFTHVHVSSDLLSSPVYVGSSAHAGVTFLNYDSKVSSLES
jgi:hypothetical protein